MICTLLLSRLTKRVIGEKLNVCKVEIKLDLRTFGKIRNSYNVHKIFTAIFSTITDGTFLGIFENFTYQCKEMPTVSLGKLVVHNPHKMAL